MVLRLLHLCYTWTALLSASQNRVIFSCILLALITLGLALYNGNNTFKFSFYLWSAVFVFHWPVRWARGSDFEVLLFQNIVRDFIWQNRKKDENEQIT